jgi:dihydroorotase
MAEADIAIVDLNDLWLVEKDNILYKCGWSPFDGMTFKSKVRYTIVNGNIVYNNGLFNEKIKGERLVFDR